MHIQSKFIESFQYCEWRLQYVAIAFFTPSDKEVKHLDSHILLSLPLGVMITLSLSEHFFHLQETEFKIKVN